MGWEAVEMGGGKGGEEWEGKEREEGRGKGMAGGVFGQINIYD